MSNWWVNFSIWLFFPLSAPAQDCIWESRPSERHFECRGLRDSEGNEPVQASLLLFFSFSPFLCFPTLHSCPVFLKSKKKVGKFLLATSLQVSVESKHAHWDFGAAHVSAVIPDRPLYHWGHFVTVCEVSFHSFFLFILG